MHAQLERDEAGAEASHRGAPSSATRAASHAASTKTAGIETLQERIDHLEAVAEIFPGGIAMFDKTLKMVVCNNRLKELLEYPDELFADGVPSIEDLFRFNAERGEYGPGDVEEHVRHRIDLVKRRVPHVYERTRPNGTIVEVRGVPLDGGGFLTTYFDVTAQRQRARDISVLIDNFPGGVAMFDKHLNLVVCNSRLKELLEYPEDLFAGGNPGIEDLFRFNAARGEYGPGEVDKLVARRMALVSQQCAHAFERSRPDGTLLEVRGIPLDGGGFVTTYVDVTEQRRAQARIAHLAHHDALTDLPNRILLQDRLGQELATAQRRGGRTALHYVDLDRFKPVNDTYGHAVGDGLLKAVAGRLRSCIRDIDLAARIGGDEFIVVQTGLHGRDDAASLAARIVDRLAQRFSIGDHHLEIGASIGIAVAPEHGGDPDKLFTMADRALYEAKTAGRGRFALAGP